MIALIQGRRVRQVLKINDDLKRLRKEIKDLTQLQMKIQQKQISDMIKAKKQKFV